MTDALKRIEERYPDDGYDTQAERDVRKLARALDALLKARWMVTPDWDSEGYEKVSDEAERVLEEIGR